MRLTTDGTENLAAQPQVQIVTQTRAAQDGGSGDSAANSAAADFLQIESIVLNLEAARRVHARRLLCSWTGGLLQSLTGQGLRISPLGRGKPPGSRAAGFSMSSPAPALFSDISLRDSWGARAPLKPGEERRFQP